MEIAAGPRPPTLTHAHVVTANTSGLAIPGTSHDRAVDARCTVRTVTCAIVAVAVAAAVVRAGQERAVWSSVGTITHAFGLDANAV